MTKENEKKYKFQYTVNICYIINEKGEVLLQQKARGFGKGNWNGPGGKVEPDETIEDSVRREIKEETDLELGKIKKIAELEFVFMDQNNINNYCYVFICKDFRGKERNTGEGKLKWFKKEEIPYEEMWDDDKYWLNDALNGKFIKKRFCFEKNKVKNIINL
ncbi:8-oxo-dGTP diphosphatase [Candidatus Parcubacteria bacterium]|nr:MAG: 8-oxo-dGTP diphosphatase [Candidatus Parcubacteria bacterium]